MSPLRGGMEIVMEQERFTRFKKNIDGIHKCLQKIRIDLGASEGVKGVHVFWLHDMLSHPEGQSAAEIAANNNIDKSLVSREINELSKEGYICSDDGGVKRGYNKKYRLTEKGIVTAKKLGAAALMLQSKASAEISGDHLEIFYNTLEKIHAALAALAEET